MCKPFKALQHLSLAFCRLQRNLWVAPDGLTIDLSMLRAVTVDPAAMEVTAEGMSGTISHLVSQCIFFFV